MESVIKWQKGLPEQNGRYLVTMIEGSVTLAVFFKGDVYDEHFFHEYVTAWCKLSDIQPYKEEE